MTLSWYVLRAVAGQEKKVKSYLETEIARQNMQDYISQILIPSEKVMEMRNGKKKIREKSFFPGYILIHANVEHGETLHTIYNIPGVIGFLGANKNNPDKKPTPLRESEVNRILGKVDEAESADLKLENPYLKGDIVNVMDGPFKGWTGTVEEVFDERKKLNVTVKIFGRNTPIELNYAQVEKLQSIKN
jgi:transcriptional antiterminator NusG